jgi:histidine triad (HIT) family protein
VSDKNLQSRVIWENADYMAFLSIFPNTEGFTVVIPKRHLSSDVLSLPNEILQEFIVVAKDVAHLLENYFPDVGRVGLIMEWTGINHAHIKLVPMHGTENLKTGEWKQFLSNQSQFFEKYDGHISSHDWPRANDEDLDELAARIRNTNITLTPNN